MRKAGAPPYWRNSGRMSGVLGQKLGRKNSLTSVPVSSVRYCSSSTRVLRQEK